MDVDVDVDTVPLYGVLFVSIAVILVLVREEGIYSMCVIELAVLIMSAVNNISEIANTKNDVLGDSDDDDSDGEDQMMKRVDMEDMKSGIAKWQKHQEQEEAKKGETDKENRNTKSLGNTKKQDFLDEEEEL